MILDEFDNEISSVINPIQSVGTIKNFPKTAVSFFSKELFKKFLEFVARILKSE